MVKRALNAKYSNVNDTIIIIHQKGGGKGGNKFCIKLAREVIARVHTGAR